MNKTASDKPCSEGIMREKGTVRDTVGLIEPCTIHQGTIQSAKESIRRIDLAVFDISSIHYIEVHGQTWLIHAAPVTPAQMPRQMVLRS